MTIVYLGVGANVGDRRGNIDSAQFYLEKKGIVVKRTSPLYETEAVSLSPSSEKMPPFMNGVFEVETELQPEELLRATEEIERALGREHKGDWKPRPIDLDILLYNERVVNTGRLQIPHPEMAKRWFVLKPLSDLIPDFVHPHFKISVKEMLLLPTSSRNVSLEDRKK